MSKALKARHDQGDKAEGLLATTQLQSATVNPITSLFDAAAKLAPALAKLHPSTAALLLGVMCFAIAGILAFGH